jgi:hypothetical protein
MNVAQARFLKTLACWRCNDLKTQIKLTALSQRFYVVSMRSIHRPTLIKQPTAAVSCAAQYG